MRHGPTFGQRLEAARIRRGWSQRELAARLGAGRRSVQRWEKDEFLPHLREFDALVKMLRLNPQTMLNALPPEPVSSYEAMVLATGGEENDDE